MKDLKTRSALGRRVLDNAVLKIPYGVVIADAEGLIINLNEVFTVLTGYTLAEVEQSDFRAVLNGPLTDLNAIDATYSASKQAGKYSRLMAHYRKNGSMFWDDYSISPVFNNDAKVCNFIGLSKDMADRPHPTINLQEGSQNSHKVCRATLTNDEITALFGLYP